MNAGTLFEQEQEEAPQVALIVAESQPSGGMIPAAPAIIAQEYKRISDVPGFEDFDKDIDMTIPRRKIVQATTRDIDAKEAGKYLDVLSGVTTPQIDAVILKYGHTRALFAEGDFSSAGLVCASANGRVPRDNIENPVSQVCDGCPMAQWGEDRTPPKCSLGYTFLCVDTTDDSPFMITFSRTAFAAAKKLISGLAMKRRPLFSWAVRMTTEIKQSDAGKWYQPKFAPLVLTDTDALQKYMEMYRGFAAVELEADASVAQEETAQEEAPSPF
jgi:hypothetical protein